MATKKQTQPPSLRELEQAITDLDFAMAENTAAQREANQHYAAVCSQLREDRCAAENALAIAKQNARPPVAPAEVGEIDKQLADANRRRQTLMERLGRLATASYLDADGVTRDTHPARRARVDAAIRGLEAEAARTKSNDRRTILQCEIENQRRLLSPILRDVRDDEKSLAIADREIANCLARRMEIMTAACA
jgi:hypothetical protein